MDGIVALMILLCAYAISELVAKKSKAVFSTVLTLAFLLLIGFWSNLLPKTIIKDAQVSSFGRLIAGILIVSLGTTIDFQEIKDQWKVVLTSVICVICAVGTIICIGSWVINPVIVIAGAPIFAGGSAATLIVTDALQEKGLWAANTFCIILYVTQKFIGIPIASYFLRKTAIALRQNPVFVKEFAEKNKTDGREIRMAILRFGKEFDKPSVYLAKLSVVAVLAFWLSRLLQGILHYFVLCLILGMIFFALGFLDKDILRKTQSSGLITFLITILIFSNLAVTTPEQVFSVFPILLLTAFLGVGGVLASGWGCSKLFHIPFGLTVSLGISCTFGFPTTMLIPQEVAEAIGKTGEEKKALCNYLLPKMLTAGFITVTIASVVLAGIAVKII